MADAWCLAFHQPELLDKMRGLLRQLQSVHKELILRAIDDETLMHCWEPPPVPSTFTETRQYYFCNLIYRLWLTDYLTGRMNLESAQITLGLHFGGEVARRHWGIYGHGWIGWAKANANRREREFVAVTQKAYEKATAGGPPVESSSYFLPPRV